VIGQNGIEGNATIASALETIEPVPVGRQVTADQYRTRYPVTPDLIGFQNGVTPVFTPNEAQ